MLDDDLEEALSEAIFLLTNHRAKFISSETEYDGFIQFMSSKALESSKKINLIETLISGAKNDEIKNDILEAITRIRERKINSIIDEKQ